MNNSIMQKPTCWDEARYHLAIDYIEFDECKERHEPGYPWLVALNKGWSFNQGMTTIYVRDFQDLLRVWQEIVNLPSVND